MRDFNGFWVVCLKLLHEKSGFFDCDILRASFSSHTFSAVLGCTMHFSQAKCEVKHNSLAFNDSSERGKKKKKRVQVKQTWNAVPDKSSSC